MGQMSSPGESRSLNSRDERESTRPSDGNGHRADTWFGLFHEVVLYGEERDTLRLHVAKRAPDEVRFALNNRMDDEVFDYPLTVKPRLDGDWARQIAPASAGITRCRIRGGNAPFRRDRRAPRGGVPAP